MTRFRRLYPWVGAVVALLAVVGIASPAWLDSVGAQVVIPAGFWAGVAFTCYYSLLAPWWRNPFGRMIVQLDLAFVLVTAGPTVQGEFGVTFSSGTEVRLLFAGLVIAAATIISRTGYLGALHGWVPRLPWRHPSPPEDPVAPD